MPTGPGSPKRNFFTALFSASPAMAGAWWMVLILRGLLPAAFAIAMGALVSAVQKGEPLATPLAIVGVAFVLTQVLAPLHSAVGQNLGDLTASWLYGQMTAACVGPPGMGHLEDASLRADMSMARDFDLGMTGPPLATAMGFIAGGMIELIAGVGSALVLLGFSWWPPILLVGAWAATHYLLRESAIWQDRQTPEVRQTQQHADYAYRLAVESPAAKEIRLFGLSGWVVDRFSSNRKRLLDLQWEAMRLRERPVLWSLLIVTAAEVVVFYALVTEASAGRLGLGPLITYASAAAATSMIAFGGLSWALDGASAPVAAVLRLLPTMREKGALVEGARKVDALPKREIRFRDVRFSYPAAEQPVLDGFDLAIPAGSSLAIVGQNGAGKTTLAKLLCRLYDPQHGSIEADGIDIREFSADSWRSRLTAVFQDFVKFQLPLRNNVAPHGAGEADVMAALADAGADKLASLDTILAKGYEGGTDLSGGQWQRVALARALCAVRSGAGVVLLDEPTAQLDVRGEAEIFERILKATRNVTTILISHRFSTVRHADRICVLEHGRVIELGSHDELMALGGRYRTMFDLQALRFLEGACEEGEDVL